MKKIGTILLTVLLLSCNNNATTAPTDRDHTDVDSGGSKRDTTMTDTSTHKLPGDSIHK